VAVAWLSTDAALHVPVIPLSDVLDKAGTLPPAHMVSEVPKLNVGTMFGLTVRVNVAGFAHWPAVGVNVYVPDAWLSTVAGFHVPVIPLSDVLGSVGTLLPAQMVREVPNGKLGVIYGFTVTVNVTGRAHKPGVGVKV